MPLCRNLHVSKDGKWLSASFNWARFWLPLSEVTKEEVLCLMISSVVLSAKRLCIDIAACEPFYTINFDGGMDLNMAIVDTMKRADFLLGAFAFGRDACSGTLFVPKEGQLLGYKTLSTRQQDFCATILCTQLHGASTLVFGSSRH